MCGFFQVIQKKQHVSKEKFLSALKTIEHRGPDAQGVHFADYKTPEGDKYYAAFGHQRLSILDLSESSNQPFIHDSHILLYNGEIYNYKSLGEELRNYGVKLSTAGDTEILMKSLIREGDSVLGRFNGMWAFSLYDSQNNSVTLSRDRYGKKPLFYYLDENIFCASSSIRAIKEYLGLKLEFRRETLLDYMLYGNMYPSPSSQTHFHKISQILPGHICHFDCVNWTLKQKPYFDWHSRVQQNEMEESSNLEDTLSDSVAARLVSDRPVGLLLSGGIDSSLLLSIMVSMGLQDQVKIFMGDTGRSDDYHYAKKSVEQLGLPAETVVMDYNENTFERFLNICWHHEKPFPLNGNAMAMPQMYEVIESEGIPVVLDGSGGDEIFGGYWERHMPFAMHNALQQKDWQWIKLMYSSNGKSNQVRRSIINSFLPAEMLNMKHKFSIRLGKQFHPLINAHYTEIWKSVNPDPLETISTSFSNALSMDVAPGGRLGEWIWHNDRNSMMSGVESRSPLLDYRLHKFLFTGYKSKYRGVWNKNELRKIFDQFQPLPTQWRRQKQGFRWDGKHFILNNKERIIELIESSDCLPEVINTKRLVALSRKFPKILRSSLGKRALCVAGIENSLIRE